MKKCIIFWLALMFAFSGWAQQLGDIASSESEAKQWSVNAVRRNGASDLALSDEDARILETLLSLDNWVSALTNCACDVSLQCEDGRRLTYHSDCGTFNDITGGKSLRLDESEKERFQEVLRKYVELGFHF